MRSRVVLPHPEDPTKTVVLREDDETEVLDRARAVGELLGDALELDHGANRSGRDLDFLPECDVAGEILADAVDRGRIGLVVGPRPVGEDIVAGDEREVLALALPGQVYGVGLSCSRSGFTLAGGSTSFLDADEVCLLRLGDDRAVQVRLHASSLGGARCRLWWQRECRFRA